MAIITNYATLQTAVGDYLGRDDLTTFIPNFIQNAENKLYRVAKLRDMETSFSSAIANNTITLPLRYSSLKYAYVDGDPVTPLTRVTPEVLYRKYPTRTGGGKPCFITEEEGNFIFGPSPDSGYTIKGIYYRYYPPLRTTDGNWIVVNAPESLLYGSLAEASLFNKDLETYNFWITQRNEALETLNEEIRLEQNSGSAPVSQVA